MEIQQVIISNIKKWRKQAGFSQEKLATLCGTAPAYIRQIEIGNRSPSIRYLVKIAGVLHIAPWQLLYEDTVNDTEKVFEDFSAKKAKIRKELITVLSKNITVNVKEAFEKLTLLDL